MPVHRFRDLDDARRALWTTSNDPQLGSRIRRLWQFTARLAVPAPCPGIRRFRSIEEANAERQMRTRVGR